MRYSKLCSKTRFNVPHDANSANAKYLVQGGFIDQLAAGIYTFLPLGRRVLTKINQIIRDEMDAIDGQEVTMPVTHPLEVWQATGRDKTMDDILFRTQGSDNKEYILSPSHEEVVTPLVNKFVNSYKDLPVSVYQIQTKFRNEPRAKSGLLRGREFGMKDMYSFHTNDEDLDQYYEKAKEAYLKVYARCGLTAYVVEASGGAFSDKPSHEFSVITSAGEDTILVCEKCQTAQNIEVATGKIIPHQTHQDSEKDLEEVKVQRGKNIAESAKAHGVEESQVLKTVVYEVEEQGLLGVVIRGDFSINELKLENYLGKRVRPASASKVEAAGLVPGFISPVHNDKIPFIGDHSITNVKNFVTGANKDQTDLINVNQGRDFIVKDLTDLVEVKGDQFLCDKCDQPFKEETAVEAGNIFKLGTKYTEAINFKYVDSDGKEKHPIMGCYGIGNTRLLGTIVEASHDEKGIIWPKSVAPYQVHLIHLGKDEKVTERAEELYQELLKHGYEVFYDDRNESPGKKFNDADLIGIPVRIVISSRTLEKESVEFKLRTAEEAEIIKLKDLDKKLQNEFK